MTRIADAAGGKVPPSAAGVAGFQGAQGGDAPAERVMNEETAALVNTTMENSMPAMLQMVLRRATTMNKKGLLLFEL